MPRSRSGLIVPGVPSVPPGALLLPPAAGGASWQIVASRIDANGPQGDPFAALVVPDGVAAGDWILSLVMSNAFWSLPNGDPSGFTRVANGQSHTSGNGRLGYILSVKQAVGNESGTTLSYDMTSTGAGAAMVAGCIILRPSIPVSRFGKELQVTTFGADALDTTRDLIGLTAPLQPGGLALGMFMGMDDLQSNTADWPAGWTEFEDAEYNANSLYWGRMSFAKRPIVAEETPAAPTVTVSSSAVYQCVGLMLGLQPPDYDFDPLTLPWTHAYWTEGPEFVALGLANGAAVSSWPDEIGTSNLVQATGANQPLYQASVTELLARPSVRTDGVNDHMGVDFADKASPNELAIMSRLRANPSAGSTLFNGVAAGNPRIYKNDSGGAWWMGAGSDQFTNAPVGTTDGALRPHFWQALFDGANSRLWMDGSRRDNGTNPGTNALASLRIGAASDGTTRPADMDYAFVGVADTPFTDAQRAALRAWAFHHYGPVWYSTV